MFATTLDQITGRLTALTQQAQGLERMLAAGPQFYMNLGQAWAALGAYDKAAKYYRRGADGLPFDANAQYLTGAAMVFAGDFEGARERLERAVRINPRHHQAWYTLVDLVPQTAEANHIEALERLFAGADAEGDRTLFVGHALAKTYEDLGDHPRALQWLGKAKAVRRKLVAYSRDFEDAGFQAAAASWDALSGQGHDSEEPIFIGGMPRSGTTLVEAILGAHPDVTAGGELQLAPPLVRMVSKGLDRHVFDAGNFQTLQAGDLAALGRAYVQATRPLTGRTARFTDKTPANHLFAGVLLRALPRARIVNLRRDPMDSILSYYRTVFSGRHAYPSVYDLKSAAEHYVRFHRLAEHWTSTLPADRYMEIGYEEIVADQEGATRRLLAFAGLSFDEATLRFHEQTGVVTTASAVQVRQPVYASSVGRWKRYGDGLEPALQVLRDAGIPTAA